MAENRVSKPLAWIGSLTAIFSLVAGVYGGWTFFSGQYEKRHAIASLLAAEAVQLSTHDYASAWKTLEQASGIDPSSDRVHQAQEEVAMQWLENIHISNGNTFTQIVDKLEPILTRGAATAKSPQHEADLLAHLGWSYFLRRRESPAGPGPESAYRDAIQRDPANPYAHAMWGHWILWNRQGLAEGNQHFTAALASSRRDVRSYVRTLQISALTNQHTSGYEEETIRVANSIRREHGELDAVNRRDIVYLYGVRMLPPDARTAGFLAAIPPPEHLATFDWLIEKADANQLSGSTTRYCRSRLLEAAGRNDEALAGYRALQAQPGLSAAIVQATQQATARLAGRR